MPSFVTHYHFAETVALRCDEDIAHAIDAAPTAYFWGAQGPDPLFYHAAPFGGKVAKLGSRLHHQDIAAVFAAMSAEAKSDPAALSYLLGFVTHYCLDRTTHPYIEDQARFLGAHYPNLSESARHKLCEADIDGQTINEYISGDQQTFAAYRLLKLEDSACHAASKMLVCAVKASGRTLTDTQAAGSLRSMFRVCRLLHGGEPTRKKLLSLEKLVGMPGEISSMVRPANPLPEDSLNKKRRVWKTPEGEKLSLSFAELSEQALTRALALCRALYKASHDGGPIDPQFFPTDYSGHKI